MAKSSQPSKNAKNKSTARNSRTTVSGPAEPDARGGDILAEKAAGTQDLAAAFPFNPNKASEYEPDAALAPHDFVAAIAKHRHFARETDPPRA